MFLGLGGVVFLVGDVHAVVGLHGSDEQVQQFVVGQHGFYQYALLQCACLMQQLIDSECGEHPCLQAVFAEHAPVAYAVAVAVAAVAHHIEAEDVFDGVFVSVEGGTAQRLALAQVAAQPVVLQFGKAETAKGGKTKCIKGEMDVQALNLLKIKRLHYIVRRTSCDSWQKRNV